MQGWVCIPLSLPSLHHSPSLLSLLFSFFPLPLPTLFLSQNRFAGDDTPHRVFSLVKIPGGAHEPQARTETTTYWERERTRKYSGLGEPLEGGEHLTLKYPDPYDGIIEDMEDMEKIWRHTFYNELRVESYEHPVLLTEPPLNPKSNREQMIEVMFNFIGVPALYIAIPAVLSLYTSDTTRGFGRSTGIVIDSGYSHSYVVPVYEGFALSHAIHSVLLAGRDLTRFLKKILEEDYRKYPSVPDSSLDHIKASLCSVALDFEEEMRSAACEHKSCDVGRTVFTMGNLPFPLSLPNFKQCMTLDEYENRECTKFPLSGLMRYD